MLLPATCMRLLTLIALILVLLTGQVSAGPASDLLTTHLYAGTLVEGGKALDPLAQTGDPEAQAARGMIRFLAGIEHVAQSLYKHGLETPTGGPMVNLPVLRIPVPPNPNPQKLDYAGFRAILEKLAQDLSAAETDLAAVGDAQIKLPIDLLMVRLDLDGDGAAKDYESLGALINAMMPGAAPAKAPVAFDTADVYWLRGYANFLNAFAGFFLAHDFHATFDKTFHLYFPRAGLPYAEKLGRGDPANPWSDPAIGDAIAFIHLINWPVIEPRRLSAVRTHLKAMAAMSRESWEAARKETDNDLEWLPNAKQTGAIVPAPVTDEIIDGWLAVMAEFEAVLDGQKLLPHWRFAQGLNLKRFFEESRNFDLVLMIAGVDAVPFLETGPLTTGADWDRLMPVFQGNFLGYAMWFN